MTDNFSQPDRIFQLWSYTVSMSRLVLRSTKTPTFASRIDVLFQGVRAIKLPTHLNGLVISIPGADDADRISAETGFLPDEHKTFYLLNGAHYSGYVVAAVMATCEDAGEYNEPSKLWPNEPWLMR